MRPKVTHFPLMRMFSIIISVAYATLKIKHYKNFSHMHGNGMLSDQVRTTGHHHNIAQQIYAQQCRL